MREAGKGDKQRPTNYENFSSGYDKAFGKPVDGLGQTVNETPDEPELLWSEQFVRDNPKLAAEAIGTLQSLLELSEDIIKKQKLIIGEK